VDAVSDVDGDSDREATKDSVAVVVADGAANADPLFVTDSDADADTEVVAGALAPLDADGSADVDTL